ncbi:MAG: hypothetical protein Unbinned3891contig1000_57 [Prokaryotic dsDNA virus sp.]|nr:MAG: hypothetical protein Unbinned3891contig1000_57 [Prokaryotic dsDNA virus sp.]|tara:strand:- start:61425 stop:62009 length:585 start_codon:yes stop_codon:yes gene_type:complete
MENKNKEFSYPEMVQALCKPGACVISGMNPATAHSLHMAVGVSGEVGEILEIVGGWIPPESLATPTREALIKECGDIEFYLQGFVGAWWGVDPVRNTCSSDSSYPPIHLPIHASVLLDYAKRISIYEMPRSKHMEDRAAMAIACLHDCLHVLYKRYRISRSHVLEKNREKLQKRYDKGRFTTTDANERKDGEKL